MSSSKRTILFTALALGLAWALRGHFGHEQGAGWAGAVGAMALIVISKRKDWQQKLPVIGLMGGLGWAVGGMMSYGLVVGYGRADDFINAYYGLSMLAVIGGLYGFIGGGFLGLELEATAEKNPQWAKVLTEMTAGGLVFWYVLVAQLEWRMTPPRSELWAACLGAAITLAWYLHRNGFHRSLRMAGYSALGAGFGFAFGNFLQIMGTLSGLDFNWWNVMEFTLGFCGGAGMAYGLITRNWPESRLVSETANRLALLALFILVPLINLQQTFNSEQVARWATDLGVQQIERFVRIDLMLWITAIVIAALAAFLFWRKGESRRRAVAVFYSLTLLYLVFSHLAKGLFLTSNMQLEQICYWLILLTMTILFWLPTRAPSQNSLSKQESGLRWLLILTVLVIVLAGLALVASNSHAAMPGAHVRFEI